MRGAMQKRIIILWLLLWLAACGQPAANNPQPAAGQINPVFAVSELVVGPNRIALGLLQANSPINDPQAKVHLKFYDRSDTTSSVKAEADATYYGQGLPAAVYVANATLDKAGEWDVVITTQLSGQAQPSSTKLRFQVLETSAVPNIGQQAIAVKTPTVSDTAATQLSSGGTANPALYQVSLDAALKSGKPTAVLFATPGFCRTAMCGPNVKVLGELQQKFGSKMNFIHVEVYQYPFDGSFKAQADAINAAVKDQRSLTEAEKVSGFSQGMIAWRLTTEPWLFLIDAKGVIQHRYEGGITVEELTPVVQAMAAG